MSTNVNGTIIPFNCDKILASARRRRERIENNLSIINDLREEINEINASSFNKGSVNDNTDPNIEINNKIRLNLLDTISQIQEVNHEMNIVAQKRETQYKTYCSDPKGGHKKLRYNKNSNTKKYKRTKRIHHRKKTVRRMRRKMM